MLWLYFLPGVADGGADVIAGVVAPVIKKIINDIKILLTTGK